MGEGGGVEGGVEPEPSDPSECIRKHWRRSKPPPGELPRGGAGSGGCVRVELLELSLRRAGRRLLPLREAEPARGGGEPPPPPTAAAIGIPNLS